MAGNFDITIEQGATFVLPVTIYHSDRTPYDLTDWVPRGQIRRTHRSSSTIKSFTCTITSAAEGKFEVTLADTDTAEIKAGESAKDPRSKYVCDVEMQNSISGEVKRLLQGNCWISPEVTK